MSSKINTLLLGLIAQKPLNPYEVEKILNKSSIRNWLPISKSSVYAGLRSLNESGLIRGEVRKENNMPEKTIYSLTEKGSLELKGSIELYLSSLDMDTVPFNIGCFLMYWLEKDAVVNIFNGKLQAMDRETFKLKKQLDESSLPYIDQAMVKHRIYMLFSEAKTIREILEQVKQDMFWNYRLAEEFYE